MAAHARATPTQDDGAQARPEAARHDEEHGELDAAEAVEQQRADGGGQPLLGDEGWRVCDQVHAARLGEKCEDVVDEAGQEENEVKDADDEQRRVALHGGRRV